MDQFSQTYCCFFFSVLVSSMLHHCDNSYTRLTRGHTFKNYVFLSFIHPSLFCMCTLLALGCGLSTNNGFLFKKRIERNRKEYASVCIYTDRYKRIYKKKRKEGCFPFGTMKMYTTYEECSLLLTGNKQLIIIEGEERIVSGSVPMHTER